MQKSLDYFFNKPCRLKTLIFSYLFNQIVPFNAPHGFRFLELSSEKIKGKLPYIRKNKNHLGGMHACVIAALGEICSGVLLLRNLGPKEYRFIMSNLEIEYHFQGRMGLVGSSQISPEDVNMMKNDLLTSEKIQKQLVSEIYDVKNNHIATVKSLWQIKPWNKVKTK